MSELLVEFPDDGIALFRINRPNAHNALNASLRVSLIQAFNRATEDQTVRVAVLTGSDTMFVAGADLRVLAPMNAAEMTASDLGAVYGVVKSFPKPLIAAVTGAAFGGGCELAMHADIIIAGQSAKFAQPEVKVGIMPGAGGTQQLTRAIGKFKAMKMALTGEPISAEEADRLGLVSEVVPDDQVLPRALALARTLASLPPLALISIKRSILEGADLPLDEALALERAAFCALFDTADKDEGMRAFLEKRSPTFRGC